jgi:hypothetical protein
MLGSNVFYWHVCVEIGWVQYTKFLKHKKKNWDIYSSNLIEEATIATMVAVAAHPGAWRCIEATHPSGGGCLAWWRKEEAWVVVRRRQWWGPWRRKKATWVSREDDAGEDHGSARRWHAWSRGLPWQRKKVMLVAAMASQGDGLGGREQRWWVSGRSLGLERGWVGEMD